MFPFLETFPKIDRYVSNMTSGSGWVLCACQHSRCHPDWKKIMLPTVHMSSILGRLCQNFSTASSLMLCAEISAHDQERNFAQDYGSRNFGA